MELVKPVTYLYILLRTYKSEYSLRILVDIDKSIHYIVAEYSLSM